MGNWLFVGMTGCTEVGADMAAVATSVTELGLIMGLILLALVLTYALFRTREVMLGFPCLMFWAILGAWFYQESSATWDIHYDIFFACMGMAIFTSYASYALRKGTLSGPDADIDEEKPGQEPSYSQYMDESDKYFDEE